jgi:hypothetical protein
MGFEKCHPAVNFIYFTTVIAGMIVFQHPIFLLISFVSYIRAYWTHSFMIEGEDKSIN